MWISDLILISPILHLEVDDWKKMNFQQEFSKYLWQFDQFVCMPLLLASRHVVLENESRNWIRNFAVSYWSVWLWLFTGVGALYGPVWHQASSGTHSSPQPRGKILHTYGVISGARILISIYTVCTGERLNCTGRPLSHGIGKLLN